MHVHARVVVAIIAALWIDGASADGSGTGPNSWIGYVFGGNQATGSGSAVAAGTFNVASGQGSFVGAGTANQANGISSLVIGGFDNRATVIDATVVAGAGNRATGARSVVVGGGYNLASGQWSFIGGGGRDGTSAVAAGTHAFDNVAEGDFSTIGGGQGNTAGTVANRFATVGGGEANAASGSGSTVAGGSLNSASGRNSVVGGGAINTASGPESMVAGGVGNVASGIQSFAVGAYANADQHRCFVFANWTFFPSAPPSCLGLTNVARFFLEHGLSVDYFSARMDGAGNRWLYIGDAIPGRTISVWNGALLSDAGVWTNNSDVASKSDFRDIDAREILRAIIDMPIKSWRYNAEAQDVRHIGPVAQDFHAAFGLGNDDKHIGTIDAEGVALAAIQGLHQLVQERDAQIAALAAETKIHRAEIAELRRALEMLLARNSLEAQRAQR